MGDRRERAAQVVTEDREERVARACDFVGVIGDGFGERLVDGFVEARHLVERLVVAERGALQPQPQYACPQRAEFRGELAQIEAGEVAHRTVRHRGGPGGFGDAYVALRLVRLLEIALRFFDVQRDRLQDLPRVIAQSERSHLLSGIEQRLGERLPLDEDLFPVLGDELCQPHEPAGWLLRATASVRYHTYRVSNGSAFTREAAVAWALRGAVNSGQRSRAVWARFPPQVARRSGSSVARLWFSEKREQLFGVRGFHQEMIKADCLRQ